MGGYPIAECWVQPTLDHPLDWLYPILIRGDYPLLAIDHMVNRSLLCWLARALSGGRGVGSTMAYIILCGANRITFTVITTLVCTTLVVVEGFKPIGPSS